MAVKPVTLKDVAQKAGVSITTVSHVINKTRYVPQQQNWWKRLLKN